MSWNPKTDFESITDDLETVTYTDRDGTATTCSYALRRDETANQVETEFGGKAVEYSCIWHLAQSEVTAMPDVGATITDPDAKVWEILSVQRQIFGGRWRCVCRRQSIESGADTTVAIDKAMWSKGKHGDAVVSWQRWRSNVRAAISDAELVADVANDVRWAAATHVIELSSDLAITTDHRIIGPDGTVYHILGVSGTGSLGRMQRLACRVDVTEFGQQ